MLVVIAIISILIGIGVNTFTIAQKKARDVRRKADIRTIQTALELYKLDKGIYPLPNVSYISYSYVAPTSYICGDTSAVASGTCNFTQYLPSLPKDPKQSTSCSGGFFEPPTCYSYGYESVSSGKEYRLYTHLENKEDPETCNKKTVPGTWWDGWGGLNNGCPQNAGNQYGNLMTVFSPDFTR